MGRQVGNFTDPITGKKHWLEVNTVKNIKLTPLKVSKFKNNNNSLIEFKLDNIDMLKVITLTAQYELDGKIYKSDACQMDELEFAEELAKSVYEQSTLDMNPMIKKAKDQAYEELRSILLSEGIIIGDISLKGIGFICSTGKKTTTIDLINGSITNSGSAKLELLHCVGNISLSNLIEPSIEFYSSSVKLFINNFSIHEETEDVVKSYCIECSDIEITTDIQEEVIVPRTSFNPGNDEEIEDFLIERTGMLDDCTNRDDILEERFSDIF